MAKLEHYHTQFESGNFYHIYNRTVDRKPLFKNHGNYIYFLHKLFHYLGAYVDIYAYALLGNHFHLLIKIKDEPHLLQFSNSNKPQPNIHLLVSNQFRRFFQCYALAFNYQQGRIGTLFQTPYKRATVDGLESAKKVILYIHRNPEKHELVKYFTDWKFTSFHLLCSKKKTILKRPAVFSIFGGLDEFIAEHHIKNLPEDWDLAIE